MSDLYAWCFDHGRMHTFDPEKPWCTAAWTALDGHAEPEAAADKQARYGDAQFLHNLPDELHLAVIRESATRKSHTPSGATTMTKINVTSDDVLAALGESTQPMGETDILLSILDARGITQQTPPGGSDAAAIRAPFNVASLRAALASLADAGTVIMRTGAQWREHAVTFYGQRPTGKYWARRDAPWLPDEQQAPPVRLQPGTLQRQVMDRDPKADAFDMIGIGSNFRGITYTTGPRKFWWAAADGAVATEPYSSRADAGDALIERVGTPVTPPVPTYHVLPHEDDEPPCWDVIRTHGQRSGTLITYTDQGSADCVAQLLTSIAPYEA